MALKKNQKVLDKNGNGKLDGEDFKIMGKGGNSPETKYKQGGESPEQFGFFGLRRGLKNATTADYGDLEGKDKRKLIMKNAFSGMFGNKEAIDAPGVGDPTVDPNMTAQLDTLRNQLNQQGYNQNVLLAQGQSGGAAFSKKGSVYGKESQGETGGSSLAKKGCTRKRY
tara:strand:+ start:425 stop:928 length:504 start_codon:yes stop_codon:yes gene_type:complete